jgi:hypothetical protein
VGVAHLRHPAALRRAVAGLAASLALVLASAGPAAAHEAPYSYLTLRTEHDRLAGTITAHRFDLAHELGAAADAPATSGDTLLVPAVAARQGARLWSLLSTRLHLAADGTPLALTLLAVTPDAGRDALTFAFEAPLATVPERIEITASLFPYDPQHETYVNAYVGQSVRLQDLLDRTHTSLAFTTADRPRAAAVLRRFVGAGLHHIFIGPDHILFVLGLLLLGGGLVRLLKIVTAFTAAHSITLALATLGWVTPPARIVEPLIALSIVFVALENLRALRRRGLGSGTGPGGRAEERAPADRRALLAFAFGFVHGFGFASVLREFGLPPGAMGLALLAFNVGVELGQASIVLVAAPLFAVVSARGPAWRTTLVGAGSCVVAAAGAWWFFERVFGG